MVVTNTAAETAFRVYNMFKNKAACRCGIKTKIKHCHRCLREITVISLQFYFMFVTHLTVHVQSSIAELLPSRNAVKTPRSIVHHKHQLLTTFLQQRPHTRQVSVWKVNDARGPVEKLSRGQLRLYNSWPRQWHTVNIYTDMIQRENTSSERKWTYRQLRLVQSWFYSTIYIIYVHSATDIL